MIVAGIVIVVIVIASYLWGRRDQNVADQPSMRALAYYRENIKNISGSGVLHGKYQITTLDGGKTWYDYTLGPNREVIIKGPADKKLIADMRGMEALVEYAQKNGPIGSKGTITAEDIKALTGAGFTVEHKK